jgi:modulator of FtsH protease
MFDDVQVIGRSTTAADIQNRVLRNTYALLGLTMIPTMIGAYFGLQMNFGFMAAHPFIFAI